MASAGDARTFVNFDAETMGSSLVVVTHDMGIAGQMDRVLELENGRLVTSSI